METYLPLLQKVGLFSGIVREEIVPLCYALGCRTRQYGRGEVLWLRGDAVDAAGIVLSGRVRAEQSREDGTLQTVAEHGRGSLFGDVLMSSEQAKSPVDVVAVEDALVLFLPLERIMCEGCGNAAALTRFRLNLLAEISDKYWALYRRLGYLSAHGLRAKLALWLLDRAREQGSETVRLSCSREQLASELGANRSALSRELSRMQRDGLLTVSPRSVTICDSRALRRLTE